MDQFRVFAEHQMMSMKTQFAISYLNENTEFKFVMISIPKSIFKQWVEGEPSFNYDQELANKKKWRTQLGTEDIELIDNLGISFTDFVCDIYKATGRLYLPTQLADSVFTAPESVLVIFREYPFAKYEVDVSLEELNNCADPKEILVPMLSDFEIGEIAINKAEQMLLPDKGSVRNFVGGF